MVPFKKIVMVIVSSHASLVTTSIAPFRIILTGCRSVAEELAQPAPDSAPREGPAPSFLSSIDLGIKVP
jgi:hypothetical protein